MVTGVNKGLWMNGGACGKRYRVRCIGAANTAPRPCRQGTVDVTVVDYCEDFPGFPCNGDLSLWQDAFAQIADPSAGVVRIEYNE